MRDSRAVLLPDPVWAPRVGSLWDETIDAIVPPPTPEDAAREAHMAQHLYGLLERELKVLWIGGAAHWARLQTRLHDGNFEAPHIGTIHRRRFRRARPDAAALFYLTGRVPALAARYAGAPDDYVEGEALNALATLSLQSEEDTAPTLVVVQDQTEAPSFDPLAALAQEESATPVDAARVLLYARNLAATVGLRSTPGVGELLQAAVAVIGPNYAGRLSAHLTEEASASGEDTSTDGASATLPCLSYALRGQRCGLWLDKHPVAVRPFWPAAGAGVQIWTLRPAAPRPERYEDLPATGEEEAHWLCHPIDRIRYRDFVHGVFRIASQHSAHEDKVAPFRSGLGDGIDARATLRSLRTGEIWVREQAATPLRIRNATIDWQNTTEFCPHLQAGAKNRLRGGWIDPSEYFSLGSCSRTSGGPQILNRDPHVQLDRREWTLLTLDRGTSVADDKQPSFYDEVIEKLVGLTDDAPRHDDVYHWLDIRFRFCAGKPFTYFSHYRPSAAIYRVARRYRVTLHHLPLEIIPNALRERNRCFRFLNVTRAQYHELIDREAKINV